MRKDIEKKLEKALEPPPAKVSKALPKPDGEHKKKRGGKRYSFSLFFFMFVDALKN